VITFDRLQQIIPADQALANKALSVALGQINGLSNIDLRTFGATVTALETTKDLPLISALTEAVPASVANYYTSTLGNGGGVNGDVRVVDVVGLAGGWIATEAFARTVTIFATIDLTALTAIYQQMADAANGNFGNVTAGPLTIPSGPAAGTYNGVVNPSPPPAYDPTSLQLAQAALTSAALVEIANLQAAYPEQTAELNDLWNSMAEQVVLEDTLQPLVNLNYGDLIANDRTSIYSFIYSLPTYGTETKEGGTAWLIEAMADLGTLGGEAIVACLREGRNQVALSNAGIATNSQIPSDSVPPPPDAELIPSVYTESEAENLVVK
jgi:hypothetical protein